jgi:hypothetical protein
MSEDDEWTEASGSGSEEPFLSHGTSHMVANPDVVKARQKADPLRTAATVDMAEPRRDNYDYDEGEGEGEYYEDEDGYDDGYEGPEEGGGRHGRYAPRESFFEQRRREKRELLTRLNRYIQGEGGPEITRMIPNKAYNLETDYTELKETVELCDAALQDRTRLRSRRFGIRRLNQATCWLSGFIEHANAEYLDPESQFAIDGFRQSMEGVVDGGELDEVHAEIWEKYIKPRFSAVDNPFLQWGMIFGSTLVSHASDRKEAYRKGELPDPRLERARIREEEARAEEEGAQEEHEREAEVTAYSAPSNAYGAPIEPGMASKISAAARRPPPAPASAQYNHNQYDLLPEDQAYDNEDDLLGMPPAPPAMPIPPSMPPPPSDREPRGGVGGEFDFNF